ncbi:Hypothetical protein Minf_1681 [Methylacidiphilum infernorum V4]|uniref:Uncharacterized protein n=1 Tax=Methylacidiphilum infernorum (isolate V4) TaxID=481448 RepID=B3DWS2_METI4|nr:Hypothetical protein Minf_1681 [Methylacidiphilum infernorum V4]
MVDEIHLLPLFLKINERRKEQTLKKIIPKCN